MVAMRRIWSSKVHNKLFELGSSLDKDEAWSFEKEDLKNKAVILPIKEHNLALHRQKRKGKPITLLGEFFRDDKELKTLCSLLKKKLSVGGTCKDGYMEFQGECQETLRKLIQELGYKVKN